MTTNRELLEHLESLELELQRNDIRRVPHRAEELRHSDFEEIGRSGRQYSRAEAIAALTAQDSSRPNITSESFQLHIVDDRTAMLTYTTAELGEGGVRHNTALRSSIWTRSANGWQLRFHQGTPTSEPHK